MSYGTAYERWAGVGPYYAMFPVAFADQVIQDYTNRGDWILDPFAGRASSVFAGAYRSRPSVGIEISPVGWIYGKTKLAPATAKEVQARVAEIAEAATDFAPDPFAGLPEFYQYCFSPRALKFLLAARVNLDWRRTKVDRTLMALILIDLHGVRSRSFSNQMRQSRAMDPVYSIKWWRKHGLTPPDIEPLSFLDKKIQWRFAKGIPKVTQSTVFLGDSCQVLSRVQDVLSARGGKPFRLVFTSPPYIGISDYHRDQWLRLWMLGGPPSNGRLGQKHKGAFASEQNYTRLLSTVFGRTAELVSPKGHVYVRTDARAKTFDITHKCLMSAFPKWRVSVVKQPYRKSTQTALYGDKSAKAGEVDIILSGPRA